MTARDCPRPSATVRDHRRCILTLKAAVEACADSEEVQASAAGAVRNMAVSDDNKAAAADCGLIELLLRAGDTHVSSVLVCAQVAGALRNLSLSDEVAERIFDLPAISP